MCITRFPLIASEKQLEAENFRNRWGSLEEIGNVPDRLRWLRLRRGLLQKEAAGIAGVSKAVYVELETGRAKRMPAGAADRLAGFYGVPVTVLLDDYSRFLLSNPSAQLRQRRIDAGLSREDFARKLGTSLSNLERWEKGECTISYKCWARCFAEGKGE